MEISLFENYSFFAIQSLQYTNNFHTDKILQAYNDKKSYIYFSRLAKEFKASLHINIKKESLDINCYSYMNESVFIRTCLEYYIIICSIRIIEICKYHQLKTKFTGNTQKEIDICIKRINQYVKSLNALTQDEF